LQKTSLKENLKKPKLKIKIESRRGNTNSTNNYIETKSENQSRAYRGANKSVETKSENRRRFKYIYHRLDLQLETQKILKLSLDLVIYSPKCWITKIFKNNGSTRLHKSLLYISSNNLHNNKRC
jgi:hypothetical protein